MSTGETTESLVEQLYEAGGWPEPQLLAAILERGGEAVGPLRALTRRDPKTEDLTAPLSLAVDLLGSLGDPSAIPDMLDLLRRYDDVSVLESLRLAMWEFGPVVIEPALELLRDRSLSNYPRSTAAEIARGGAGDDTVARARVAEGLRELLAEYVSGGDQDNVEEAEMATSLVNCLTDLADPLARDLIAAAYSAGMVDEWMIAPEDVERSYLEGGRTFEGRSRSWLPEYEREYEKHREWLLRKDEPRPRPLPQVVPVDRPGPERPVPLPLTPLKNATPRPGRNDPCWCGSGKKYKKCHLSQDQA